MVDEMALLETMKTIMKQSMKNYYDVGKNEILYNFLKTCIKNTVNTGEYSAHSSILFEFFFSIIGNHLVYNREKEFVEILRQWSFLNNQFNNFSILSAVLDEINKKIKEDEEI